MTQQPMLYDDLSGPILDILGINGRQSAADIYTTMANDDRYVERMLGEYGRLMQGKVRIETGREILLARIWADHHNDEATSDKKIARALFRDYALTLKEKLEEKLPEMARQGEIVQVGTNKYNEPVYSLSKDIQIPSERRFN